MFYLTRDNLPIFLPLGFIGLYRWFWFVLKLFAYWLYKPIKPRRSPKYRAIRDVTILVPTIDSGEEIKLAIKTWLKNKPYEIIFITTEKARAALEELGREVDPDGRVVRVITVGRANKRNQMTAGINHVKTEITVFCDDDVLWPDTMLKYMLAPFEDKRMGGVGTSQVALPLGKRMTIWEILAAYRLSLRNIEITATTYIDGGVCCLSGRTAAYRTSILRDPAFQWEFTHEFWRGKYHQHSGDDKFLTRWLHSHNWRTYIQCCSQAELSSTFKDNWRFLKQILRWTRNTWRSDIKSLFFERQIWTRHPFTAFTMIDKFFNPITLLAGPVTVIYLCSDRSAADGLPVWVIIVSYIVWLCLTRLIKYTPHFCRRPQDALAIPVWLVFNIAFAIMKVYCLFTLHVTDWGTRTGADHKEKKADDMEIYVPRWMGGTHTGGAADSECSIDQIPDGAAPAAEPASDVKPLDSVVVVDGDAKGKGPLVDGDDEGKSPFVDPRPSVQIEITPAEEPPAAAARSLGAQRSIVILPERAAGEQQAGVEGEGGNGGAGGSRGGKGFGAIAARLWPGKGKASASGANLATPGVILTPPSPAVTVRSKGPRQVPLLEGEVDAPVTIAVATEDEPFKTSS
ncbi:hypothetical protein HK101_007844 [Irineochytrium annulatum]|nr:hypothetical protein HK101_007844 [Irineochytrium annulatum]